MSIRAKRHSVGGNKDAAYKEGDKERNWTQIEDKTRWIGRQFNVPGYGRPGNSSSAHESGRTPETLENIDSSAVAGIFAFRPILFELNTILALSSRGAVSSTLASAR